MIMTERLASITSRSSFCSMFLSSSAIVLHFDPYLFNNNNVLSSFLLLSLELVCVFHCWLMLKTSLVGSLLINTAGVISSFFAIIIFGSKWDIYDLGSWFLANIMWFSVLYSWSQPFLVKGCIENKIRKATMERDLRISLVLIGAWCGAIPFLLDWDRTWQVWPSTCLMGMLFGDLFSYVVAVQRLLL